MGDATAQELVATIQGCACGEFHCSPRMAAMLVRRVSALAQGVAEDRRDDDLTLRERTIVGLIDNGLSNKEIARRLGIELSTVKNHVHRILEKLHAPRGGLRRRRSSGGPYPPAPAAAGWIQYLGFRRTSRRYKALASCAVVARAVPPRRIAPTIRTHACICFEFFDPLAPGRAPRILAQCQKPATAKPTGSGS